MSIPHWNKLGVNVCDLPGQSFSSLPSGHSYESSHRNIVGIHSPVLHWNRPGAHSEK